MSRSAGVSARQLTMFYLPLAANAGLMMLSHVINNAGLGRLADASYVLAGYALGRNLAMFTEAPVLMMRQTAITLVHNRTDLHRLIRYVTYLSLALFLLTIVVVVTPLGQLILKRFLNAPEHLWQSALWAFLLFAGLPLLSGIRSVYQGILLYQRQPGVITLATTARAVTMGAVVAILTRLVPHWGASIGTVTFMAGLAVEAAVSFAFGRTTPIARSERPSAQEPLNTRAIVAFSAPLVVLGLVDGVANGAITASLARGLTPELTIAAFTVTWSLVAVLIVALQSIHQVIMVFGQEAGGQQALIRFVTGVAVVGVLLLAMLAFIPQGQWLYTRSLGLSAELAREAIATLQWFVPLPIAAVIADTLVGRLLVQKRSRMVAAGKIANMWMLILAALLIARMTHPPGAATGPVMMLLAAIMEVLVLSAGLLVMRRHTQSARQSPKDA